MRCLASRTKQRERRTSWSERILTFGLDVRVLLAFEEGDACSGEGQRTTDEVTKPECKMTSVVSELMHLPETSAENRDFELCDCREWCRWLDILKR